MDQGPDVFKRQLDLAGIDAEDPMLSGVPLAFAGDKVPVP